MPKPELYQALAVYNRCMNERVYESVPGFPMRSR